MASNSPATCGLLSHISVLICPDFLSWIIFVIMVWEVVSVAEGVTWTVCSVIQAMPTQIKPHTRLVCKWEILGCFGYLGWVFFLNVYLHGFTSYWTSLLAWGIQLFCTAAKTFETYSRTIWKKPHKTLFKNIVQVEFFHYFALVSVLFNCPPNNWDWELFLKSDLIGGVIVLQVIFLWVASCG